MTTMNDRLQQQSLCGRYRAEYSPVTNDMKVGIARNVKDGVFPIHGLRHPPAGDTTGWYIWAGGEPSEDPDFFVPLHIEHVTAWCPEAIRFLGLPPGWRFLVTGNDEDVWQDSTLLDM